MANKLILVIVFVISFLVAMAFQAGVYYEGKANAEKMSKLESEKNAQILALQRDISKEEKVYAAKNAELNAEIAALHKDYADRIESINLESANRLRDSESRAAKYRALSEAGGSDCRELADFTGRLDGALSEGIGVVEELEGTVKLQQELSDRMIGKMKNDVIFVNRQYGVGK